MRASRSLVALMLLLGCSGRSIDVGPSGGESASAAAGGASDSGAGGTGATGGTAGAPHGTCTLPPPAPVWTSATDCVSSSDLSLVGTWTGYQENAMPPWDTLTLEIDGASLNGGVCGKLTIGTATALAPATRADEAYPPGSSEIGGAPSFYPGYAMTLLGGQTDGTRVQFTVGELEYYRDWCQLQTPYQVNDTTCNCMPSINVRLPPMGNGPCSVQAASGDFMTVDCGQALTCSAGACTCSTAGCDADSRERLSLDLRFSGDTAEGSADTFENARIHFTRAQ